MMNTAEKIAVMQAYLDEKKIEFKSAMKKEWSILSANVIPIWNWAEFEYRIKPEPKVVKCLLVKVMSEYKTYDDTPDIRMWINKFGHNIVKEYTIEYTE